MNLEELKILWNNEAGEHNQWDTLSIEVIVDFAQWVERDRCAQICEELGQSYENDCSWDSRPLEIKREKTNTALVLAVKIRFSK